MSALKYRRTKHAVALAAVCVLCTASTGEPRDDDYVARGLRLLRALYPGLHHVHVNIGYADELEAFPSGYPDVVHRFWINLSPSVMGLPPWTPDLAKRAEPVLGASFEFDLEKRLLRKVWVSGPFVDGRLDKLKKELDEHPDWPDSRLVEALKAAGAKYGPDDRVAFLRAIPLKELEPYTGRMEVISARFGVRFPADEGERPKADLTWFVDAKWRSPDGQREAFRTMTFEPFDGALKDFDIRLISPPWGAPK
jgi:hypothetical protein